MKKIQNILLASILLINTVSAADIGGRCSYCLPNPNNYPDGYVVTDSSGHWVAQPGGGGGGGSPAGSNTQVQFNNNGSFGADAGLQFTNPMGITPTVTLFNQATHQGVLLTGSVTINNSDATGSVGLKCPVGMSIPYVFQFPIDPGIDGQSLFTDGAGNTSWQPGVQTAKVTLSSAQVLASGTQIQLIAAPGSGKVLIPISITENLVYSGTAYATHTTWLYKLGTTTVTSDASILSSTTTGIYSLPASQNYNGSTSNQPLYVVASGGNPAAGNSQIVIYITYYTLTL